MTSGGARNRSGPPVDPNSERSQQRGLAFKLLPRKGFTGRVPRFPLPNPTDREKAVWRELWRTPQAAMWNIERHRMGAIAHYCRLLVRCEDPEATASLYAQLHRFGDQLGLTPAGLKENGWRLAQDELAEKRDSNADAESTPAPSEATTPAATPTRRLRAVK